MDHPDLFRRLAHGLPVQPLLDAVAAHPELWAINTTRQTYPGSAHRDTECIFLRWCKDHSLEAAFRDLDAEWLNDAMGELNPAYHSTGLDRIGAVIGEHLSVGQFTIPFTLGRVILTNLHAGGTIDYHTDEGAYAEATMRYHLSLQSDEGNLFFVDGNSFHATPGEMWWFNHRKPHMVVNKSQRDRLHLILDVLPC